MKGQNITIFGVPMMRILLYAALFIIILVVVTKLTKLIIKFP